MSCLGLEALPSDDWCCANCSCKFCHEHSSDDAEDIADADSSLRSCSQCEEQYHQACSPEIDSITSDSDQSCNLFCQKSCRLVLLLWLLFFFPPWALSLLDILPYCFLWAWFLWWYLHLLFLLCTQPLNICTIFHLSMLLLLGFPLIMLFPSMSDYLYFIWYHYHKNVWKFK